MDWNKGEIKILKEIIFLKNKFDNHKELLNELKHTFTKECINCNEFYINNKIDNNCCDENCDRNICPDCVVNCEACDQDVCVYCSGRRIQTIYAYIYLCRDCKENRMLNCRAVRI